MKIKRIAVSASSLAEEGEEELFGQAGRACTLRGGLGGRDPLRIDFQSPRTAPACTRFTWPLPAKFYGFAGGACVVSAVCAKPCHIARSRRIRVPGVELDDL